MPPASRPRWQQMTALVSLGTGGTMTGFSLVPGTTAADLASPTNAHVRLLALQQQTQPAVTDEAPLRAAIVNVAHYYLRMAQSTSPSEMEALIWQHDSIDGADHGPSCAAFASLTLEMAAQVVGQQSWVTGGGSYPWPVHPWVDARVDPNPGSPGITSVLQDAQAHHRWHPLGDGYEPRPGDWVLFDGHVEVITGYSGGVLHTIGGDSLPNFSVNAHQYPAPLGAQGVVGFVNNGALLTTAKETAQAHAQVAAAAAPMSHHHAVAGQAAIPGVPEEYPAGHTAADAPHRAAAAAARSAGGIRGQGKSSAQRNGHPGPERTPGAGRAPRQAAPDGAAAADVPGAGVSGLVATLQAARRGAASIPGLLTTGRGQSGASPSWSSGGQYRRYQPPSATPAVPASPAQQAFIKAVAQGAIASQRMYGVPAAVTIAQAIDESGWGQSLLATQDHNLFGIKGTGPAGSDMQPTEEFVNGQAVSQIASFRVYHDIAQSIEDHGRLLATGAPYQRSMTLIRDPNSFASSLTGVYATDPVYGSTLIGLMQRYHLYRYDAAAPAAAPGNAQQARTPRGTAARSRPQSAEIPGVPGPTTKPGRARAPRTPTSSSSAPTSPAPNSPAPTSPSSTAPAPAPTAPATTAPAASAPAGGKPSGGAPPATGTRGGRPPADAARTRAPGQAAAQARPPQAPDIPGVAGPTGQQPASPSGSARSHGATQGRGTRLSPHRAGATQTPATQAWSAQRLSGPARHHPRTITAHATALVASRYESHIPPSVSNEFTAMARGPLTQAEPLYRDIAGQAGLGWQLLAACDWMQCQAQPRLSPVHGERLGTINTDGMAYRTKSSALEQCAHDLIELARAVYGIDLTGRGHLSVRDLASVFAAFRWGALLRTHHTSAMEFPYSVAGLTIQHLNMRWPKIEARNAPDKPGGRFRLPFGAVPVMLSLHYPATV